MDEEVPYYLVFSHFLGIGPQRFKLLKEQLGSAQKIYQSPEKEIAYIIGENLATKFEQYRHSFDIKTKLQELRLKKITVLTQDSEQFPQALKNLEDVPICLYVKGDTTSIQNIFGNTTGESKNFFGIVGTRRATSYGLQVAKKFSYELASAGFIIVSGLALGIDSAAHWACLDAGQKTVAFLGCGVDIVYPPANKRLYETIIEKGGLIISEFPPGHTVQKGLFIARNRLISGLSRGVMVVEGTEDSGSLVTAKYAAMQGKDVFAPPAPITSQLSQAPNLLIKQGARLVTSVDDILEEFQMKVLPSKQQEITGILTADEKRMYELLVEEPHNTDELVNRLGINISVILSTLSSLEIKDIIELSSEGKYQVRMV